MPRQHVCFAGPARTRPALQESFISRRPFSSKFGWRTKLPNAVTELLNRLRPPSETTAPVQSVTNNIAQSHEDIINEVESDNKPEKAQEDLHKDDPNIHVHRGIRPREHGDISDLDTGPTRRVLNLAGIPVDGVSVGGFETCIQFPQHKFAFDIGRCPSSSIKLKTILITHGHMDHIGGLPYHAASRGLHRLAPPTYIIPPHMLFGLQNLFAAYRSIDMSSLPCTFVPLAPGQEYELPNKLIVKPFSVRHTVSSQGYGIYHRKKKLKAKYQHLEGEEIRRLRYLGTEVSEFIETPEIAFTGDTIADVIDTHDIIRKAKLLVIECTFVDETKTPADARSRGHIHLDEIIERADLLQNEHILLTHFSARYTAAQVTKALERKLPPSLKDRVTPLLTGFK